MGGEAQTGGGASFFKQHKASCWYFGEKCVFDFDLKIPRVSGTALICCQSGDFVKANPVASHFKI